MSDIQKRRPLSQKVPWQLVLVLVLLAAGLFALARVFNVASFKHARAFMESELATVAGLKADQIRDWREKHLAFALALQANPSNAENARVLAAGRDLEKSLAEFETGMRGLQKSLPFLGIELVLAGGKTLAVYPRAAALPSTPESLDLGHEAWREGRPLLGTVILDEKTGSRTVEMVVPLMAGEASPKPVALFRMIFDAATEIDPMLNDWPNRRGTAEALLLQVKGENFVRLSQPRLHGGSTPPPPIPLASFHRPGAEGALGQEGIVEGRDYRGRQVLEYLRAVPDSPWLIAVKTDLAELTSGMAGRELILSAMAGALVLVCGGLLYFFWRRTLAAEERAERTKWNEANANMDEFMRQLIAVMPNPAFFKDTQGAYQGANAGFEKLLGLSQKEIIGKTIGDVAPGEIVSVHQEHDQALLTSPGYQIYEAPLQAWDGIHKVVFIKSTYQRPDGRIGGIVGILKDLTQRLRAEEELEQLRIFSESTIQTMTEGLVLTDSAGKFSFVNPAAARMLGYTPSEMVDQDVFSFIPKDQRPILKREDEKRAKGISDHYELVFQHKDGSRRTFLVSGGPRVQGAQFAGTLAVLTDITERKSLEEEIKALSLRDQLTTLYNRRGFLTLAEQHLKTANRLKKKVAALYLDMDNLKRINDTGGHKTGDRALAEMAFILKKSFRDADIVGRLGGDEFSVLAMETNRPLDPDVLVRRLREKLDLFNARSSAEAGFSLAASVGVVTRDPDDLVTIEEMLSRADMLMYEEKKAKKGGDDGKPPGPSK
ncbi:MAG TPA: diguanylate cyclase [Acidobacteriota bacterium]|nr:diguanylate cyclase [Acidobacteriota bacterium]